MTDPRAENCRGYREDGNGKVVGVHLTVDVDPWKRTEYELVTVRLIDENMAQGQTVATVEVEDGGGVPVILGYPWPPGTQNQLLPGGSGYPVQHMIGNAYAPPGRGPLSIWIRHEDGSVNSDICGGLGLPHGHHVSYYLRFAKRGTAPPPDPEPPSGDLANRVHVLEVEVGRIIDLLDTVRNKWGSF